MADPARLVVLSPNWLGDAVMALPAVADLRRRFPRAHLAVAARGSVAPMFELTPGVDAVVTLGWKGRVFDRAGLRADAGRLRDASFDAAVLLPNSMASAWLVRAAGVPERWGYAADFRSPLLTRAVPKPKGSRHQARYYQHLTEALGAPPGVLEPVLIATATDLADARALLASRGWDGVRPLVVLAP
ncbi:MAG TPA: glycosyltransferase family 9 protein, partial [Gemmatimonadales bacterium]|nr:glycosyltransferase family 9 protein [Gemmatimonadales bacterium]